MLQHGWTVHEATQNYERIEVFHEQVVGMDVHQ